MTIDIQKLNAATRKVADFFDSTIYVKYNSLDFKHRTSLYENILYSVIKDMYFKIKRGCHPVYITSRSVLEAMSYEYTLSILHKIKNEVNRWVCSDCSSQEEIPAGFRRSASTDIDSVFYRGLLEERVNAVLSSLCYHDLVYRARFQNTEG